jgi:predicted Rossmann fold flavoprotein
LLDHAKKIGERIRISGGGRCNFTNRRVSAENFLSQNPHFCRSALTRFGPQDFIARVQARGIGYHEKTLGQLFCDDSASAIVNLLRDACDETGVRLLHPCNVHSVQHSTAGFSVLTDHGGFESTALIVATGGLAAPALGASPLGYRLAEQFGIPVVAPRPALVPLALDPDMLVHTAPLAGVALPVQARVDSSPVFREQALFTHRGLSGPAILQASSYWQQALQQGRHRPLTLDLLEGIDLDDWPLRHRRSLPAKAFADWFPQRFAQAWSTLHSLDRPLAELSAKKLTVALDSLRAWTLTPSGTLGYNKAEVTLGGVDTRALSSQTMAARAVAGLYFIGEVVDVTGWLGGYNFQWAWSSAWVAAQSV